MQDGTCVKEHRQKSLLAQAWSASLRLLRDGFMRVLGCINDPKKIQRPHERNRSPMPVSRDRRYPHLIG